LKDQIDGRRELADGSSTGLQPSTLIHVDAEHESELTGVALRGDMHEHEHEQHDGYYKQASLHPPASMPKWCSMICSKGTPPTSPLRARLPWLATRVYMECSEDV
jgi:hypothetical protein